MSFQPFTSQVSLVLTCCVLNNWILEWGLDGYVLEKEDVTTAEVESGHGVEAHDEKLGNAKS